jgi:choline-sulfatase
LVAEPSSLKGSSKSPPNILWIVWDTVRADRLSLYGYAKKTTPFLESFSREALVFDNALSSASSTLPSHASLFTGLLPSEHGTHERQPILPGDLRTIAESLADRSYQSFFWAANPFLGKSFARGFDREEHPWDPDQREAAAAMVRRKTRGRLPPGMPPGSWLLKAAGELAEERVVRFLEQRHRDRPWLVFLNYMEAHRPWLPPKKYRNRMLSPEQVEASYQLDLSWERTWSFVFGLEELAAEELQIMSGLYDASLLELDSMLESLLTRLQQQGLLDQTLVIITADHGELLGEHHLLDHQFSLYAAVTHVPLILWGPELVGAGRNADPVMSLDLFPTILELAGVDLQTDSGLAVSLLRSRATRQRLAEYPAFDPDAFRQVQGRHPGFQPQAWMRRLRALHHEGYKLIEGEDGRHELYHWRRDPAELQDLWGEQPDLARAMQQRLEETVAQLRPRHARGGDELSEAQRRMLQGLGYAVTEGLDSAGNGATPAARSSWRLTDPSRK